MRMRFMNCVSAWLLMLSLSQSSKVIAAFSPHAISSCVLKRETLASRRSVWKTLRGGEHVDAVGNLERDGKLTDTVSHTSLLSAIPKSTTVVLATAWSMYCMQLEKRPIRTKSVTAGFVFGLSDLLAQRIENSSESKESKIGWTRLMCSAMVGLFYFGPAAHYWYEWIFRLLPGTGLLSTLQKAFWGQVIFGPSFTCIFFATSLLQAGTFSFAAWASKIRNDLPSAWLAGAGYWPLVDLISFSVIPVKWIPLFINACSLVWTVYLSLVSNRVDNKTS